jgi:hypothetical protein
MLPHTPDPDRQIVYFPYWRYRGIRFSCIDTDIQHKFLDITHPAVDSPFFPASMGLRAQAMRLSFVSSVGAGRFLKPVLSMEEMLARLENRFESESPRGRLYHHAHVGDVFSLIYAPFYVGTRLVDAVLNRSVSGPLPDAFCDQLPVSDLSERQLRFLSALCPTCGWNLSGKRNAVVLTCTNCNSAWQPIGGSLKPVPVGFLPDDEADLFLPYWRISADVSGVSLSSYADLVRLANLPRVVQKGWEDMPFYFWSLGFRLSPKAFLTQSVYINLTQPQDKPVPGNPKGPLYPVTLPVTEAVDALKISLAGMVKPVETRFPQLPQIHIKPLRFSLVYVPFHSGHHEWLQPKFSMAINKNLLSLTDH